MEALYREIKRTGHIVYQNPLTYAGPGTMVGGTPKRLSLVAPPETCFPSEVDDVPTELRQIDETVLPTRSEVLSVGFESNIELINFMSSGNPVLGAGVNFNTVHQIALKMEGVHLEYLDSIKLTRFYLNLMDPVCKDYLEVVAFIIQAIKVDRLEFTFYSKTEGAINIDLDNINEIIDISVDLNFHIENNVNLIIESPKYIGYQLGFTENYLACNRSSHLT